MHTMDHATNNCSAVKPSKCNIGYVVNSCSRTLAMRSTNDVPLAKFVGILGIRILLSFFLTSW